MTKIMSLQESVGLLPENGGVLGLGGVTNYRRPMAFALAMLANPPSQLVTLLAFTAGLESDLLVGAGLVAKVRTCYFGLEAFGLAPNFTQASDLEFIEGERSQPGARTASRTRQGRIHALPGLAGHRPNEAAPGCEGNK